MSEIIYVTANWSWEIKEYELVSETELTIVLRDGRRERRRRKAGSSYEKFHRSKRAAIEYLITRAETTIRNNNAENFECMAELDKLKKLLEGCP